MPPRIIKILLIDAEGEAPAVITGSYNFTWSAQARNAENVLILRGNPAVRAPISITGGAIAPRPWPGMTT